MIPVSTVTRLHQASLLVGLAAACALPVLVLLLELPLWLIFIAFFVGLVSPTMLVCRYLPRKDEMRIDDDRLTFQRRKPVLFSDIDRYNTDDYLKLIRRGHLTLLLRTANYDQLRDQFVATFEAWERSEIAQGIYVKARRTHFYGSRVAKLIGAAMIVGSVLAGIFAIVMLPDPPYGAMGALVAGVGCGIMLISKRGPNADDDDDEDEDEEEEARRA